MMDIWYELVAAPVRRLAATRRLALVAAAAACCLLVAPSPGSAHSSQRLPAATVKAREAFFGPRNVSASGHVRSDRVILSWFGVSSLAASFRGHVVLLDSYINGTAPADCTGPRPGAPSSYVGARYAQLVALKPRAIFIGHEHFDHECRTGELLVRTGARLVGLPQACSLARAEARAFAARPVKIRCAGTLSAGSPFGARREIRPLGRTVPVTVIRNLHSGPSSAPPNNSGGAEALLFRFGVGRFSLVWNDSSGPLREWGHGLLATLRRMAPSDVDFGASWGLGYAEHGFRDAVDYAEALRARYFYPLHQDFGETDGSSRRFRSELEAEFASRPRPRPTLRWLQDPTDYLRPIAFDPGAKKWR